MNDYCKTARRKIAELIRKDNFSHIAAIDKADVNGKRAVYLEFEDASCKVDVWGRVTWARTNL